MLQMMLFVAMHRILTGILPQYLQVCKPRSKDKGVELLLSSSVDLIKQKTLISELGRTKPNNETKGTNHYNMIMLYQF